MPRYFMGNTRLSGLERMMMTPPNFTPRGHGKRRFSFRYRPMDVDCQYCANYDKKNPCSLDQCVCLEERIEAGVLDLFEFVRDRFGAAWAAQLQKRLEKYLSRKKDGFFLDDAHRSRWNLCLESRYQMNNSWRTAYPILDSNLSVRRHRQRALPAKGKGFKVSGTALK